MLVAVHGPTEPLHLVCEARWLPSAGRCCAAVDRHMHGVIAVHYCAEPGLSQLRVVVMAAPAELTEPAGYLAPQAHKSRWGQVISDLLREAPPCAELPN